MDNVDIREKSGLVLAYLGDSVWETEVRMFFIQKGFKLAHLNREVKKYVNAREQSKYYNLIKEWVTEEEIALMKRAKNASIRSFPKTCSNQEYREATAFEALVGAWYLKGQKEKIEELKNKILQTKTKE